MRFPLVDVGRPARLGPEIHGTDTGQLAQGVVRDDAIGSERADLLDQGGGHLVERGVDEPGTAGAA